MGVATVARTTGLVILCDQLLHTQSNLEKLEFQINQFAQNNQRTPAVAAFATGGFQVAWISEKLRATLFATDIMNIRHEHLVCC